MSKLILIADDLNLENAFAAARRQIGDEQKGLHWISAVVAISGQKFFVQKNKTGTIISRQDTSALDEIEKKQSDE